MQLEDYFEFLEPYQIRIKGHRVGIEHVLYEYIHNAKTPEEIAHDFPTITLEDVYATILYYLHNKATVHAYLTEWIEYGERMRAEQERHPTPTMIKVRHIRAEWEEAEHCASREPDYNPDLKMERLRRIAAQYRTEDFVEAARAYAQE